MTENPTPPGDPNQPLYGLPPGYQYQYGHGPYDDRFGYGPPGVGAGPRTQVTGDDTTWGLMSYLGTLIIGFIAPLIIYFVKRNESAFVRHHAAQSLNYQLTIMIQMLAPLAVAIPLAIATDNPVWFVLAIPAFVVHMIGQWVFLILGTIKAGKSEYYRFPTWTCFRMIR